MRKLVKLKCPSCNADLSFEPSKGKEFYYCQYCGTKLIMDNDNEHIIRHIDDADVKRAETEQLIKIRQIEIDEKKREDAKKLTKTMIYISIVSIIIGSIFILMDSINENFSIIGTVFILLVPLMWMMKGEKNNKK